MSEITSVTHNGRIMSKSKASIEGVHEKKEIAASLELKELKQFEVEMQKALILSQDIRHSLENALRDLS